MPHESLLDAITLSAMTFHARVGVLPHEREIPQPLEIDLTAWVEPGGAVVDYRGLYDDVRGVVHEGELLYLEDVAQGVAARVLGHRRVLRVRVAVRKPHAAVGGPLGFAEVAVVRERHA